MAIEAPLRPDPGQAMRVFEGRTAQTIAPNACAANRATLSAAGSNFDRRATGDTLLAPGEAAR